MKARCFRLVCVACLLGVVTLGCSRRVRTAQVSGKVLYQQKPVTAGLVVLAAEDGSYQSSGPLNREGAFEIPNAPVGRVKVAVQTQLFKGTQGPPNPNVKAPANVPASFISSPTTPGPYRPIPPKYESLATTDLTVPRREGGQVVELELK